MSALPSPPPLLLLLALLAAPSVLARRAESSSASQPEEDHQLPPDPRNGTRLGSGVAGGGGSNSSGNAVVTRISSLLRDLPTLKATVIVACTFSALLIACLLLRVFRSGKRLKKTRKYDIITTPAERVEMAPLNEEDDEDEDATVFDIKYRIQEAFVWTRREIHSKQLVRSLFSVLVGNQIPAMQEELYSDYRETYLHCEETVKPDSLGNPCPLNLASEEYRKRYISDQLKIWKTHVDLLSATL